MNISVIIASDNRSGMLHRTLESLLKQDYDSLEVVVVLDGLTRSEVLSWPQSTERCHLQVIEQPKGGQAAAINRGIRAAKGEVLLFLDDDVLSEPNLVRTHALAHENLQTELAFGAVLTSSESADNVVTERMGLIADSWFQRLTPESATSGWFFSFANPNTSARRDVIIASGCLDESFSACCDTEFGFRLWKQGLRWQYLPGAIVHHVYKKDPSAFATHEARERGRAEVQLCRKHPEFRQFCSLAEINRGRTWQRVLKQFAVVKIPAVADAVLAGAALVARPLRRSAVGCATAQRLLTWRYQVNFYRGASQEVGSWHRFSREYCVTLPVLLYHRVGHPVHGEWPGLSVTPTEFRRHMQWLKNSGWQTITIEQWLAWREHAVPLPEKPLLLTFDDGYLDNIESAYPLLHELGFTATTFLVTERLGMTSDWDEGRPAHPLMNTTDVEFWRDRGFSFEPHSHSHPNLTHVSDAQLISELEKSHRCVTELTGNSVAFAYPYGASDQRVRSATGSRFKIAFSADAGLNWLATETLTVRRSMIMRGDNRLDLWCYLRAGWSPFSQVRFAFRDLLDRRRSRTTAPNAKPKSRAAANGASS